MSIATRSFVLADLRPGADETWHVNFGASGGRHRPLVAEYGWK